MWLVLATLATAAGIARDASPVLLALLAIPWFLGVLGLLQAREKT